MKSINTTTVEEEQASRMSSKDLLVFFTSYNEEKTIGEVLEHTQEVVSGLTNNVKILVIDDGSEDNTVSEARDRGVTVVRHPQNLGPGAATQTGYKYAVRNNFDVALRMDADGQHPPKAIPKLVESVFEGEADIVIGSRYIGETGYEMDSVRDIGIRFYSWAVSITTGERVHDLTSGYRAVRINMVEDHAENLPSGIVAINRGVREGLSGFRIKETPVKMDEREHGSSFLSAKRTLIYPIYSIYSFITSLLQVGHK